MLYLAFVNARRDGAHGKALEAKSRVWWNEGGRPEGLKIVGMYGCIGTQSPAVFVFEAENHDDIRTMISYWHDDVEFDVHPAVNLADEYRKQGMHVG